MNANASRDVMESEERNFSFALVRKLENLYYEWALDNYYTAGVLQRIHRHFFHLNQESLRSLETGSRRRDNTGGQGSV